MSKQELSKTYSAQAVEDKWYQHWEKNKYFRAEIDPQREPFCIVMPPPNVTGELHMGHALDNTLQDILTRWRRMQGYNALWLPGTDHAGIATQARVEEQLTREGTSKDQLGREAFLKRVWQWKEQYGHRITTQLRKLGASCDWDRERFTMDEGCYQAVQEAFIKLYNEDLIYRDNYITNWCPHCSTTISDIEVEHQDQPGQLYHFKYPLAEDPAQHVIIATTRPETMLGDVAVAVHPEDDRYLHLVGQTLALPLVGRKIPIIADAYVDPSFGTGCVKITPAHDPNDFEIGKRHGLPEVQVIDQAGKMNAAAGEDYQGMDRYQCRAQIIKDLEACGALLQVDDHHHAVGHCYRCNTVIEPMLSKQWFVRMKPLAKPAIAAAHQGDVNFVPQRFTKIYLNWMENIRDWCISRQLWWGHRIPVYYCQDCDQMVVAKAAPEACPQCDGGMVQDPDVLDTWFSSALWPFSTLGWPDQTDDLKHFYPTSVLVTGRDIIFFWVARMIFSGLYNLDEVPFKDVFIHGLVLDSEGQKMSKSLGNGIDPLEVIASHGADSLRFMLVTGNTPGNDLRFRFERLDGARNFANKLWNASRFALMNLEDYQADAFQSAPTMADRWIMSRFHKTVAEVTDYLERYELGEAARVLYEFTWSELCDWYIELVKPRLYGKTTPEDKATAQAVLVRVLRGTMELLHPFMPFITEEIWQHLPHQGETIMLQEWPGYNPEHRDLDTEHQMELLMETITEIRRIRGEMKVPPGKVAEVILVTAQTEVGQMLAQNTNYIANLAQAQVEVVAQLTDRPTQAAVGIAKGIEVIVPLKGLIDFAKEVARLNKELAGINKDLGRVQGKLKNQGFLAKAPAQVVEKERAKEAELLDKQGALTQRLEIFS